MKRSIFLAFIALSLSACSYDTTNDSVCGAGLSSDALGTVDCECSEKNVNFCDMLSGKKLEHGTWTCNTSARVNRCEAQCDNGYSPDVSLKACVKDLVCYNGNVQAPCRLAENAKSMKCSPVNGECMVNECNSGYEPSKLDYGVCIEIGGVDVCGGEPCTLVDHANEMECFDFTPYGGRKKCVISQCETGYTPEIVTVDNFEYPLICEKIEPQSCSVGRWNETESRCTCDYTDLEAICGSRYSAYIDKVSELDLKDCSCYIESCKNGFEPEPNSEGQIECVCQKKYLIDEQCTMDHEIVAEWFLNEMDVIANDWDDNNMTTDYCPEFVNKVEVFKNGNKNNFDLWESSYDYIYYNDCTGIPDENERLECNADSEHYGNVLDKLASIIQFCSSSMSCGTCSPEMLECSNYVDVCVDLKDIADDVLTICAYYNNTSCSEMFNF